MSMACLSLRQFCCNVRLLMNQWYGGAFLCGIWRIMKQWRRGKKENMKTNFPDWVFISVRLTWLWYKKDLYQGNGLFQGLSRVRNPESCGNPARRLVTKVSSVGALGKSSSTLRGLTPSQPWRHGYVNHISTTWGIWLTDRPLSATNHVSLSFLFPHKASLFGLPSHPISQENIYLPISEPADTLWMQIALRL